MKSAKSWGNTIIYNKMKCIIVLITVLLLVACNKEQKPVTFSEEESFMDVTPKFYSVNGAKIGLTDKDLIENGKDSAKAIIEIFRTKKNFNKMWYNDKIKKPATSTSVSTRIQTFP